MTTWPALIGTLLDGGGLSYEQTRWALDEMVAGHATEAQIAAFVVALRAKGETVDEVLAFADGLQEHSPRVDVSRAALDIVGTGGDQARTVNISTMAAIVSAAAGQLVVKHGNRAASSSCGTADVLEYLGVAIDLDAVGVREVADKVGISFCFAGKFHRSLANAGKPRREIGVPTVFNMLGPLSSPARPRYVVAGVATTTYGPILAGVMHERGIRALVVHGSDGLDEITVTGPTSVWHNLDGKVSATEVDPRDLGVRLAPSGALLGGDVDTNAQVVRAVLEGRERGPIRDAVLLNTAAGLVASGTDNGELIKLLDDGMAAAREAIDSGRAAALLERWIDTSRKARK